jgi:hypothetical protein
MTRLTKPVRRETGAQSRGRAIIVELQAPSIIRLREKGRRTSYALDIRAAYDLAAKIQGEALRRERKALRKAKREGKV